MSKIIAWLVLIFVVLLALRLISMRNTRARRRTAAQGKPAAVTGDPMVRCVNCGVFLPQGDARSLSNGYACADGECAKR
jgi:hypothetical protein